VAAETGGDKHLPYKRTAGDFQVKKMLIIGLDSATFDIIMPMVQEGRLPNLSSLIRYGCLGRLRSTIGGYYQIMDLKPVLSISP